MPLTDSQVKSLKPQAKRYSKSDGNGLSIDVMPTGKKSWTLEIIDLFDAAKANKQFKALIIKALQDYKNKAPN